MTFDRYRRYTQARIGLGHAGPALPTKAWLEFALHHARAIDAIKMAWDLVQQADDLKGLGYSSLILKTQVRDREEYLLRPDLGRALHDESQDILRDLGEECSENILIMASNGLSSSAVTNHLEYFLKIALGHFKREGWAISHKRIFLVPNARVGLIDAIGEILKPTIGIVLIGERPGLSAPDSLAAYLTYKPQKGRFDAERNCISNIRPPHGLAYEEAAAKLIFLVKESLRRKLSGVPLKEESAYLNSGPK